MVLADFWSHNDKKKPMPMLKFLNLFSYLMNYECSALFGWAKTQMECVCDLRLEENALDFGQKGQSFFSTNFMWVRCVW